MARNSIFSGLFEEDDDEETTTRQGFKGKSSSIFTGLFEYDEKDQEEEDERKYKEAEKKAIEDAKKKAGKDKEKEGGGLVDTIGGLFLNNTAKVLNTGAEGVRKTRELGRGILGEVTGNDAARDEAIRRAEEDSLLNEGRGLFGVGGVVSEDELGNESAGEFARTVVGTGVGTATEVLPFARGYQVAANSAKGARTASVLARGAVEGTAMGAAGGASQELLDDDGFDIGGVGQGAAFGGVLGAGGALLGRSLAKGKDRITGKPDAPVTPEPTTDESRLLGTGADWRQSRLDEIDNELAYYQGRESTFQPEMAPSKTTTMDNLGSEGVGTGGKLRADGTRDMRTNQNKRAGEFSDSTGQTAQTKSAGELRALMKERAQLEAEMNGTNSLQYEAAGGQAKMDMDDPKQRNAVENELKATESALEPLEMPTKRSSIVDYARVPTDALRRIGLGKTADLVERSFETYRRADVNSGRQIEMWQRALNDDEAARRIFHSLDGDDVQLAPNEQAVRDDIKSYLTSYADDLGLTEDQRVSDYITHVFDDVIKGKSVDASFRTIGGKGKLTGDINDPNLKSRTSESQNYSDDLWNVLDIYTKRANRKIHMEPAVKQLADIGNSKDIDGQTARYLERMHDSITMKPSRIDEIFNDVVSSIPGVQKKFGAQAGTDALRAWRQNVYRATLGLNFGSALRNVTQLTNTFTEVPTKDFAVGLSQAMRSLTNKSKSGQDDFYDELIDMGIFDDAIHKQDMIEKNVKSMGAVRRQLEKVDPTLFVFFNAAERLNRGATYAAGKSHALRKLNMSEEAAKEYASNLVSKTQFKFNTVETPLMFNSQVGKTLTQFASYPVRQAGYMAKTVKGAVINDEGKAALNKNEIAKIVKWTAANLAMAETLGQVMGFDLKDSIPNLTGLRDLKSPTSQVIFGGENKTGLVDVARGEDAYGNTPFLKDENGDFVLDEEGNKTIDRGAGVRDFAGDQVGVILPGGAQAKKSYEGMQTAQRGTSETAGGGIRFATDPERDVQSAVFGQYSTPEAREFYADKSNRALSSKQSDMVREKDPILRGEYINFFRTLQKTPTKKDAIGKKVDKAVADKQYEKAQRLAAEHNAQIKAIRDDLVASVGGKISPELEDYLNSQYMVNYSYYRNKKRATK